jgi:hypothetical protein
MTGAECPGRNVRGGVSGAECPGHPVSAEQAWIEIQVSISGHLPFDIAVEVPPPGIKRGILPPKGLGHQIHGDVGELPSVADVFHMPVPLEIVGVIIAHRARY